MLEALRKFAINGGLVCMRGGFWTFPGCRIEREWIDCGIVHRRPEWYAATNTVKALAKRGLVSLNRINGASYPTAGIVTDEGHAALAAHERGKA